MERIGPTKCEKCGSDMQSTHLTPPDTGKVYGCTKCSWQWTGRKLTFVNICSECEIEMPETIANDVRLGYCSEECWNKWLDKHKDDYIFAPYIPMQTSKIK